MEIDNPGGTENFHEVIIYISRYIFLVVIAHILCCIEVYGSPLLMFENRFLVH